MFLTGIMAVTPEYGWYGAGFAVFKGGKLSPEHTPPLDNQEALNEWLQGFGHAHADYPSMESMELMLEGDFYPAPGDAFEDHLLSVAAPVYVAAIEQGLIEEPKGG